MRKVLIQALAALALLAPALPAAASDTETRFIRITQNERKEPVALQTAVAKYVGEKGVEVDLVAVVHVGEKQYYQELNQLFEKYETVLYELVAPEGTRPSKGGELSTDPLSLLQKGMQLALRLEHQLEIVDYRKANFVHADLSLEGLRKAMKDRGEDEMTVFFRAVKELMEKASSEAKKPGAQTPDLDVLLDLLRDPSKPKKLMAEQLASADGDLSLGKTLNQLVVIDRNKAAVEVLRTQLKAGRKRIAIFYGGAHMPDFDKRLKEEFGLRRVQTTWLNAWNL